MIVREAIVADADAIAALAVELGYQVTGAEVAERLPALEALGEPALVAEAEQVIGCLTWHVTPVLHRPGPVGRITMMVVTAAARGQGVGRALVAAAEVRCRGRGCSMIEVTSNVVRAEAHAFYERLGYEKSSFRFAKPG